MLHLVMVYYTMLHYEILEGILYIPKHHDEIKYDLFVNGKFRLLFILAFSLVDFIKHSWDFIHTCTCANLEKKI